MIIANPTYLNADPDLKAILANQLALFCVSLPILSELPIAVCIAFVTLMAVRILLLFLGIRWIPLAMITGNAAILPILWTNVNDKAA